MEELSIFIDESGDFGKMSEKSPFYIVTLVFHQQKKSIKEQVRLLKTSLDDTKIGSHTVHSGPLIRRENIYSNLDVSERLKIFNKLFNFTRKVEISYKNIIVDKKYTKTQIDINNNLSKQLSNILKDNLEFFQKFDKIIIYYDNGQLQLANMLVSVFSSWFHEKFDYRIVSPHNYRLFQTADLICTLSLIKYKNESGRKLSSSELLFFGSYRKLRLNYLKYLNKIEF